MIAMNDKHDRMIWIYEWASYPGYVTRIGVSTGANWTPYCVSHVTLKCWLQGYNDGEFSSLRIMPI